MILVIDNYDSFTFNLVDLLLRVRTDVKVVRNDACTLEEIQEMAPEAILISPGPGHPQDGQLSVEVAQYYMGKIPILGICLGHQILGMLCGEEVVLAQEPMHGKTSTIQHDRQGIFTNVKNPLRVMRYHSLLLRNNFQANGLIITAKTSEGEVMGIRHKIYKFAGVQFHPESILTEEGDKIIRNWLNALEPNPRSGNLPD